MKSQKVFRVTLHQAQLVYDIFRSCDVYVALKDGEMCVIYNFSGNCFRSSLNALRSHGFRSPRFKRTSCIEAQPELLRPYALTFDFCYIYF